MDSVSGISRGSAFLLEAPCRSLSISFCEYRNLDGIAFNASQFFTTYTGDSSTFALYKTTFSYQKLVHSGPLFVGSWAANNLFQNVVTVHRLPSYHRGFHQQ